jgi:hypothetical protein
MSENVTLDRIDFEKLKQQAQLARADYMRRCGTAFIKSRHTRQAIAVVAVLFISFGVKMFFLSAPTAEAGTHPSMKTLPTAIAHTIDNWMRIGEPPYP